MATDQITAQANALAAMAPAELNAHATLNAREGWVQTYVEACRRELRLAAEAPGIHHQRSAIEHSADHALAAVKGWARARGVQPTVREYFEAAAALVDMLAVQS